MAFRGGNGGVPLQWQPLEYYHISLEENLASTQKLLDASEESLLELTTEPDREVHTEGSMTKLLDWE